MLGCGRQPVSGWINLDNSWFVRLSHQNLLLKCLHRLGMASVENLETAARAKRENIIWGDAALHIPVPDHSVSCLYSSHMLEHLDADEVSQFMRECRRVMAPKGIIRLVVPDLRRRVNEYVSDGDANKFMRSLNLESHSFHNLRAKLRILAVGNREHQWMYDSSSLVALLKLSGFVGVAEVPPGVTGIPDPGALDLRERESESIYVEGRQP